MYKKEKRGHITHFFFQKLCDSIIHDDLVARFSSRTLTFYDPKGFVGKKKFFFFLNVIQNVEKRDFFSVIAEDEENYSENSVQNAFRPAVYRDVT